MFATTFFAIFVVPISRNPIVKPFLVLENGQIRDQLINSGAGGGIGPGGAKHNVHVK